MRGRRADRAWLKQERDDALAKLREARQTIKQLTANAGSGGLAERLTEAEADLAGAREERDAAFTARDQALANAAESDAALKRQAKDHKAAAEEWQQDRWLLEDRLRAAQAGHWPPSAELARLRETHARVVAELGALQQQNDLLSRQAQDASGIVARVRAGHAEPGSVTA